MEISYQEIFLIAVIIMMVLSYKYVWRASDKWDQKDKEERI